MSRNQHQLEYDHMGSFGSNANWKELTSDPSSAAVGVQTLFARPGGFFYKNSAGLLTGPLGPTGAGTGAFGSNANDVGNPSSGGANSSNSRADHVHLGVRSVTANTSNSLTQPNVGLVAGPGIAFGVVASTLTISNIAIPTYPPTVRFAAGVPSGAPVSPELPIAFDSTAVSGGVYYWTGIAWVKGAKI